MQEKNLQHNPIFLMDRANTRCSVHSLRIILADGYRWGAAKRGLRLVENNKKHIGV